MTVSTTVLTSYTGTGGLGVAIHVQVRDASTGGVLLARTNTAIREDVTGSGVYVWSGVLADAPGYEAIWDENDGVYFGGVIGPVILTSPAVIAATAPASVNPLQFTIKRGDTDPPIQVQALVTNPANPGTLIPWPIPGGATVKFTMRDNADLNAGTRTSFPAAPKVHATASIDDAPNGILSYGWAVGDTDTDGLFRGEFEVTSGSEIRTFPVGTDASRNWIAITITDDLDPGITP